MARINIGSSRRASMKNNMETTLWRFRYQRHLCMEPLEDRSLLSASTADALLGALVSYQSGDKGDTDSPLTKIGYDLASVYANYTSGETTTYSSVSCCLTSNASSMCLDLTSDYVLLDISSVNADPTTLAKELADLGFISTGTYGRGISGWLPIDQIDEMASLSDLLVANAVTMPQASSGTVTSEGDVAMNADVARATYGVDGTGVTVGILSDSFNAWNGYATDVASGDLPSGVTVLQDYLDTNYAEDEGRAMAQIVHDVAPGASIAFATGYTGQYGFASNIKALADAGCSVIVDDVYYYEEPFFSNGVVAQAVNDVAEDGIAYFSSAGNEASNSYESTFTAGTYYAAGYFSSTSGYYFQGGTAHDFDSGTGLSDFQTFTLAPYVTTGDYIILELQWDQSFASVTGVGATSDVDMYILDSNNKIVAASYDNNIGADPSELIYFYNPSSTTKTYKILIVSNAGDLPNVIKYVSFGDDMSNLTYATNSSTCVGHSNTVGAAAVGAAAYYDTPNYGTTPAELEDISSYGGTKIYIADDGTRLATPLDLHKVDFVAPDGGSTTVVTGYDFSSFDGTSAAAPHAAAVAALMLDYDCTLTPSTIITTLKDTALPMDNPYGDSSYNYASGAGLIQADAAIAAIVAAANQAPSDISLTASVVSENSDAGTVVGSLTTVDPDAGDSHAYLLVDNAGGRFVLSGDQVLVATGAVLDYETAASYTIRIRSTDDGGRYIEKDLTISVTNVNEVTSFNVQNGATSRSYIRYLDLAFEESDDLAKLIADGRLQLTKYGLDGSGGATVGLSGVTSVSGNRLAFNFGSNGLGGNAQSTTGDGYYNLALDLDGNGTYETHYHFFRLLGDVNGDGLVNAKDTSSILAAYGRKGTNLNEDVNGDGVVNALDRTLAIRSLGRQLSTDLDDDLL